jgi:hypothetical protein
LAAKGLRKVQIKHWMPVIFNSRLNHGDNTHPQETVPGALEGQLIVQVPWLEHGVPGTGLGSSMS